MDKKKSKTAQIPRIPVADEIPEWVHKIGGKDTNFLAIAIVTGMIALFFLYGAFQCIGESTTRAVDPSSIVGFFLLAAVLFAITGFCIFRKKKIDDYFKSEDFSELRNRISKNTNDINDLNNHIKELESSDLIDNRAYEGYSELTSGGYNFKRTGWGLLASNERIHRCSLQVVEKSKEHPYQYVCKYFNLKPNEENLNKIEELFNNYSAVEQGKYSLISERNDILASIDEEIPVFIKTNAANRFMYEIGIEQIDINVQYYPKFLFQYVSAGGNSMATNTVTMDLENLEGFIGYMGAQIKWRKSVAGQRALMTSSLREEIKRRDHYTCQKCGVSTDDEPHLLLEIDHIKPLAKGGMTTEDNLQTLCWRCNRSKGTKAE